jgi:hypothetical protein
MQDQAPYLDLDSLNPDPQTLVSLILWLMLILICTRVG